MPWTSADLATLDQAIASGVSEVHYADRTVRYQKTEDLLTARTEIVNYLAKTGGTAPQTRMVKVYTKTGYGF